MHMGCVYAYSYRYGYKYTPMHSYMHMGMVTHILTCIQVLG